MGKKRVIWRKMKGFEKYYQISNIASVRSIPRRVKIKYVTHLGNSFTRITYFKSETLTPRSDINGYLVITLHLPKIKVAKLHRLVAENFIPKVSNKNLINHKNGNIRDNRIENLEWVNSRENVSHRFLNKKSKSSRFIGVYKSKKKWIAQIQINGAWNYLGYFEKEKQAAKAYERALKKNKLENKYLK